MSRFADLGRVAQFRYPGASLTQRAAKLVEEAAELLKAAHTVEDPLGYGHRPGYLPDIDAELGDVLVVVASIAAARGVDPCDLLETRLQERGREG